MPRVPRKNISPKITDIRPRGEAVRGVPRKQQKITDFHVSTFAPEKREHDVPPSLPRRFTVPRFVAAFLLITLLAGGAVLYYGYNSQRTAISAIGRELGGLYDRVGASGGAVSARGGEDMAEDKPFGISDIFALFGSIGKNYRDFQLISDNTLAIADEMSRFRNEWLSDALLGNGDEVIARLENIHGLVREIKDAAGRVERDKSLVARALPIGGDVFFGMRVDLERMDVVFTRLIAWLKEDNGHYVAVFLENPSEVRPGGGFIGSYVELFVQKGNVSVRAVRDVSDADKLFDRKIIPPQPLQLITKRWRAADANWFSDFSESASTVLSFLEDSGLYGNTDMVFDGALGVSANAVGDVLAIIGPVTLSDKTKVDADNFLHVIQERVQEGQASGAAYPKEVLRELAPLLVSGIADMTSAQKEMLGAELSEWLSTGDIRLFAREDAFQNFFDYYGIAGDSFQIPEQFVGDYLAVVQANIGGAKSDLFVKQNVHLESQILEEGIVNNRLTITREHTAKDEDAWWYAADNQVFTRIFAPQSAFLTYANGGLAKTIKPRAEYATGYETIARVSSVESTVEEYQDYPNILGFSDSGKKVFASWVRTPRGGKSELSVSYTTHLPVNPADGRAYEFVFDRQPGVFGNYHFEINAPVGYVFEENNLPVYEYADDVPPARTLLRLTFRKISE